VAGTLTGYALNRTWTFRAQRGHLVALPRYFAVQAAALLLNLALLFVIVDGAGVAKEAGQAIALPAVSLATFATHRRWTFDPLRPGAGLES
jgi:putative flippase GtrA